MIQVYGIPNCDSVKKVRVLLDSQDVTYTFHDYKKLGVPEVSLREWVRAKGWEALLNRKGTTWRGLDDETRQGVKDAETAVAVMLQHPSIIKRPVVTDSTRLFVGVEEVAANYVR